MNMLGASTSFGSQRCNASNGEALLNTATELMGKSRKEREKQLQAASYKTSSAQAFNLQLEA
jgi:hypothetical protein